ncbi:hypothetical protein DRN74_02950 [Candidatus Micrarchaeota archaeon]|nr:MAG: hypothetical protein DRN74_02950 [Candidatus Micrarchaeota archaeon]
MDNRKATLLLTSLTIILLFFEIGIMFNLSRHGEKESLSPLSCENFSINTTEWEKTVITKGVAVYERNATVFTEIIPIEISFRKDLPSVSVDITGMLIGEELQFSVLKALYFAQNYSKKNFDYAAKLKFITTAKHIDGKSATAAIATAFIAFLNGKRLRKDAFILADMDENGNLLNISKVKTRVEGAIDYGASLIIVAATQCGEIKDIKTNSTNIICAKNLGKAVSNLIE